MDLLTYLPKIKKYLAGVDFSSVPGWQAKIPVVIHPLAQGEYNMNYLLSQAGNRWVLRVNMGSKIDRLDQIAYEFNALRLLETSGVTPKPYWLDDQKVDLEFGVLLMEYLPGGSLAYETDLDAAALLLARLHDHPVDSENNHLIRETRPLSQMYEESSRMAEVYYDSEFANPVIASYLTEILDWAKSACDNERYYLSDPWFCVINTEVNSGNFIADRNAGKLYLVDWEKPLWGDPSQDLSHFCAPTTTLWKTGYRMPAADRMKFLNAYRNAVSDPHLKDTIIERVRLRDPFNCLRGITWSAMAYIQYRSGVHVLQNSDTFEKIQQYLQEDFLHSLFDPYIDPACRKAHVIL